MGLSLFQMGGIAAGEIAEKIEDIEERRTTLLDQASNYALKSWETKLGEKKKLAKTIEEGMGQLDVTGLDPASRFAIAQRGPQSVKQALDLWEKSLEANSEIDFDTIYTIKNSEKFEGMSDSDFITGYIPTPKLSDETEKAEYYVSSKGLGGGFLGKLYDEPDVSARLGKMETRARKKGIMAPVSEFAGPEEAPILEVSQEAARSLYAPKVKTFKTFKEEAVYWSQKKSKLDPTKDADEIEKIDYRIDELSNFERTFGKEKDDVSPLTIDKQFDLIAEQRLNLLELDSSDPDEAKKIQEETRKLDAKEDILNGIRARKQEATTTKPENRFTSMQALYTNAVDKHFKAVQNFGPESDEAKRLQEEVDYLSGKVKEYKTLTSDGDKPTSPYSKQSIDSIINNAYANPAVGGLSKFLQEDRQGRLRLALDGKDIIDNYQAINRSLDYVEDRETINGKIAPEIKSALDATRKTFSQQIEDYKRNKESDYNIAIASGKIRPRDVLEYGSFNELKADLTAGPNQRAKYIPKIGDVVIIKNPDGTTRIRVFTGTDSQGTQQWK